MFYMNLVSIVIIDYSQVFYIYLSFHGLDNILTLIDATEMED